MGVPRRRQGDSKPPALWVPQDCQFLEGYLWARKRLALILVWALSLVIVAAIARAQSPAQRGTIISGSDLGFRVERQQSNRVMGTFVVRINGEWIVAEPAPGAKALTLK